VSAPRPIAHAIIAAGTAISPPTPSIPDPSTATASSASNAKVSRRTDAIASS